ncbi:expressed unknown protein [Seminavis robusta]|uniref:Gamma-glutamylcyclotransferase n=1 Tax=Seminavis robusta TaxID=568900 RepID=A0A9N8F2Q9_9STRA|nr:expressed unknown protein [Seminavis robusta]|eukprot:Sro2880_g339240.1 n/a (334) ;mRNA; r:5760-6761
MEPKPGLSAVSSSSSLAAMIKEELQEVVPQVKPRHFVFAYGSLICRKSRAITAPTLADKEAIPVQIQDVERMWAKRTQRGMTAMGVRFRPGAVCTGVLLPVTDSELKRFDQREMGYDRYPIPLENVEEVPFLVKQKHYEKMDYELADVVFDSTTENEPEELDNNNQTEVFVWIYVQRYDCPANEDFPIAQSYVDIILRGCMGISKDFARSFIETTVGWTPEEIYGEGNDDDPVNDSDEEEEEVDDDKETVPPGCVPRDSGSKIMVEPEPEEGPTWVDDRDEPIYMRADPVYSEKKADMIDQLLEDHVPEQLDNREPVNDDDDNEGSVDDGGLA